MPAADLGALYKNPWPLHNISAVTMDIPPTLLARRAGAGSATPGSGLCRPGRDTLMKRRQASPGAGQDRKPFLRARVLLRQQA